MPQENEVTKAIQKIKASIPLEIQNDFVLVATCISENIFTDEIIEVHVLKTLMNHFIRYWLNTPEMKEEHASYFIKIMEAYWDKLMRKKKAALSKIIPAFILHCLDGVHDNDFLVRLLREYGFNTAAVETLTVANNNDVTRNNKKARVSNIIRFLKTSNVWAYAPLAEAFSEIKELA